MPLKSECRSMQTARERESVRQAESVDGALLQMALHLTFSLSHFPWRCAASRLQAGQATIFIDKNAGSCVLCVSRTRAFSQ